MSVARPPAAQLRRLLDLIEPARSLLRPEYVGFERIPDDRPLLFVGNHTLYGVLDVGFFWAELYGRYNIFLRALGDHLHFKVPGWRDALALLGAVDGTPENCAALMQQGECVLVFPGGGREVAKRKGEAYQLVWKQRTGFARLAIAHRCTIVPFASVGVEHALDVRLDADDLLASPVGPLIRALGVRPDIILPLATGIGPTPLPRPERLYFQIQPPIRTGHLDGQATPEACAALRDEVKASVEAGIADLIARREKDPKKALLPRLLDSVADSVARRTRTPG